MCLVKKPEMTEANLEAHRANGSMSHGAVTPERQGSRGGGQFAPRVLFEGAERRAP